MGRRVEKKVFDWNGSSYNSSPSTHIKFANDGWRPVAELNGSSGAVVRSYLWGKDLSGSLEGAGGIGGMLMVREGGATYAARYDANGNLVGFYNLTDNNIALRVEYGPYGQLLTSRGYYTSCPFRFSTKYQDAETGLYYFGYRYYNAETGRWLSRDPIVERGGPNVYEYVFSQPMSHRDALGLELCNAKKLCNPPLNGRPNVLNEKFTIVPTNIGNNPRMMTSPESWREAADLLAAIDGNCRAVGGAVAGGITGGLAGGRPGAIKGVGDSITDDLFEGAVDDGITNGIELYGDAYGGGYGGVDKIAGAAREQGYWIWIKYEYERCVPCCLCWSFRSARHLRAVEPRWYRCKAKNTSGYSLDATSWGGGNFRHPTREELTRCLRSAKDFGMPESMVPSPR